MSAFIASILSTCKLRRVDDEESSQQTCQQRHNDVCKRVQNGCPNHRGDETESRSQLALIQQRPHAGVPRDNRESLSPGRSLQDRESALIVHSVIYYNEQITPRTTPSQLPFRRNLIPADLWHLMPPTLKHIWIVIVRTRQAGSSFSDPMLYPDLCLYRGRSLTGLREMLSDSHTAIEDPYAAALMSVLFVVGADMQLCEEHWTTHLDAARVLISQRGGLGEFLRTPTIAAAPLVNFSHADIMTATTCDAKMIDAPAVMSQVEYLDLLPALGISLLANGHVCPQEVLLAITRTNLLRVSLPRLLMDEEQAAMEKHEITFEKISNRLKPFHCTAWANSIAITGRQLPQRVGEGLGQTAISCLAALAQCYKSAALLYLILSTKNSKGRIDAVDETLSKLTQSLTRVFEHAGMDYDGPLHMQLWKFTVWPLFVSAYVKTMWSVHDDDTGADADIDRFPAIALALSSTRILRIPKFIRQLRETREMEPDRQWRWDDAFGHRLAFVV